jgi:hypothetical protein
MKRGGGEGHQEDIEEGVPVARGRYVTLPGANLRFEAPQLGGRWGASEGPYATGKKGAASKRGANNSVPTLVIRDEEIRNIRRDSKASPREAKEGFVDAVEGPFDVSRGEEDGGASLRRFLQSIDMLRQHGVDSASRLIGVLRGVKKPPFGPEPLDATHDDSRPNFTSCFNEGYRADVGEVDGVENLRKRGEEAPLPSGASSAMLPEEASVLIGGEKEVMW